MSLQTMHIHLLVQIINKLLKKKKEKKAVQRKEISADKGPQRKIEGYNIPQSMLLTGTTQWDSK